MQIIKGYLDGLRPIPRMTVSEWSDQFRYLSSVAAAESGLWKTSKTPYLKEIMDALSAYSTYQKVVSKKGAQLGFTEAGNNWIGYIIDAAPGPTLMVQPTDDMVKRNSKMRIDTMIEATPRLRQKIAPARNRDSNNTINSKGFPGGILVMAGANSAAGLRSMPARNLFLDEVDSYPQDLDGEGSPIDLAIARTRTYGRKKIYIVSTPTVQGHSVIDAEFESTDQRHFFVPCPHCGCYQTLKFERLRWQKGKPETVAYSCEHCEEAIPHRYKAKMLANGRWIATKPENANPDTVGFFISSLYSPFAGYTWSHIAADYEDAIGDTPKMKTFVNTVLGECWKEEGEAPPYKNLYNRREEYQPNTPNKDVAFITAGVDVQKDRLELELVGWCEGKRAYSIDYRVLMGDTAKLPVWDELAKVVGERWVREDGAEMPLRMMAVDTGYNTSYAYDFCRRFDATRVVPVKGSDSLNLHISAPRQIDTSRSGRKIGGTRVWMVGSSMIKSEIYGCLRLEKQEDGTPPPGYCHFPQYDENYFKGLTCETLQFRVVKGFRKYEWVKPDHARNEPLDCRVYARAAAAVVGMDRFTQRDWQDMYSSYVTVTKTTEVNKKRRSSYWD